MPTVRLKVTRWLQRSLSAEDIQPEDLSLFVPDGESIPGMVRRLAAERGGFWKLLIDGQTQEMGPHVVVVLNGCIVNVHDRSEALLKEGDELMFLPPFDGG